MSQDDPDINSKIANEPNDILTTSTTTLTTQFVEELTTQLFISCVNNNIVTMKLLIEQKADPNGCRDFYQQYNNFGKQLPSIIINSSTTISALPHGHNNHNNSLLHAALISNNVEMIQYVINDLQINNFKQFDYDGNDALLIAMKSNSYHSTKYLIEEYHLDIHYSDSNDTFFHHNITNTQIFDIIIDTFNILQSKAASYERFIMIAQNGQVDYFQYLVQKYNLTIDHFRRLNHTDPASAFIDHAIASNHIEMVDYLVEFGFRLKERNDEEDDGENVDFEQVGYDDDDNTDDDDTTDDDYITDDDSYEFGEDYYDDVVKSPYTLFSAIESYAFDVVKHLILKYNFNPFIIDQNGNTILHQLMKVNQPGSAELIKFCIEELGFDPNIRNSGGITPIYIYQHDVNISGIEYLLQLDNINLTLPPNHPTLFSRVLKSCTVELIKVLQKHHQIEPYINSIDPYFNSLPIQRAALYSSYEVLELLLEYKIQIPIYTKSNIQQRRQLLLNATQNADQRILDYFLQHPHIHNQIEQSELHSLFFNTIECHNYSTTKLFIEKYNIKPTIQNCYGRNLLNLIFKNFTNGYGKPFPTKLFYYLLSLNCFDLSIQYPSCSTRDYSLLVNIVSNPQFDIDMVQAVIKHGGDINQIGPNGQTILHAALRSQSIDIIHYIMDNIGIDDSLKIQAYKDTILDELFVNYYDPLTLYQILHKYPVFGSLINTQDRDGNTLLHHFIITGSSWTKQGVTLLLQLNPDVEIVNNVGLTPLFYLLDHSYDFEVAKLLINETNCNLYVNEDTSSRSKLGTIFHSLFPIRTNVEYDDDFNSTPKYDDIEDYVVDFMEYVIQHRFLHDY